MMMYNETFIEMNVTSPEFLIASNSNCMIATAKGTLTYNFSCMTKLETMLINREMGKLALYYSVLFLLKYLFYILYEKIPFTDERKQYMLKWINIVMDLVTMIFMVYVIGIVFFM